MAEFMLVALLVFVVWGVVTSPHHPFSWAMYSGSTKGFLWTEGADGPRVLSYEELGLAPDSHFLSTADLRRLVDEKPRSTPVNALVIGYRRTWLMSYAADRGFRVEGPLPPGAELDHLVALLRRLPIR